MPQILSNAHRQVIINGHRVVGLASEDRPIEWGYDGDNYELERGDDGGLYGKSIANVGGTLTVRLDPTSPSTRWALDEQEYFRQAIRTGQPHRTYSGVDTDQVQGRTRRFEGAFLQTPPGFPEPGVTVELMFSCELVTDDVAGGTFLPPFSSP